MSAMSDESAPSSAFVKARRYVGEVFEDRIFYLDGNSFVDCTFDRCTIHYTGVAHVHIEGCKFRDCDLEFDGPAVNTMTFLRGLYNEMGEGGQHIVNGVITFIQAPSGVSADLQQAIYQSSFGTTHREEE